MHDQTIDATTEQSSKPGGLNFARFLYNQNPFYLISAALVLYGFSVSITQDELTNSPWVLASLFSGYITLLALSAWAIVRFGKVWDDARSILMVLLLLLLALSSSVDLFCMTKPQTAAALAAAGFAFAVVLSEFLIRSLGIKFGPWLRGPLYSMLGASFFFPLVFAVRNTHFEDTDARILVLAFPFLCAACLLTLIPAITKGRAEVAENGTPWKWPFYPYSAFVLLAVGLCFRIAMVTWSFDHSSTFGMLGSWLYVPLLFAAAWILFEFGVVEESTRLRKLALNLLPLGIPLAMDWSVDNSENFYHLVTANVASPVWLTMVGLIALLAVVRLRGFGEANPFIGAALILAALLKMDGQFMGSPMELQAWPFVCIAILAIASYGRRSLSVTVLLAASSLSVPVAQYATPFLKPWFGGGEVFTMLCLMACLILAAAFVMGLLTNDRLAKQLRVVLAYVFPTLALLMALETISESHVVYLPVALMIALALASFLTYLFAGSRLHLCSIVLTFGVMIVTLGSQPQVMSSLDGVPLLQFMVAGIGCLGLGLLVSAMKAGWSSAMVSGLEVLNGEIHEAFGTSDRPALMSTTN